MIKIRYFLIKFWVLFFAGSGGAIICKANDGWELLGFISLIFASFILYFYELLIYNE